MFWVKLALLAVAVGSHVLLDRHLAGGPILPGPGWRIWAVIVAAAWLAVAVAGRLIGLN